MPRKTTEAPRLDNGPEYFFLRYLSFEAYLKPNKSGGSETYNRVLFTSGHPRDYSTAGILHRFIERTGDAAFGILWPYVKV